MEIPLLDLHQKVTLEALLCQHDLDHKQEDIVSILGGINGILNHYIASGDLDDDRMGQIIAVIRDESMSTNITVDNNQILLTPDDSILQKLFPGPFSDRICAMIRSKILMAVSITMALVVGVITSIQLFVNQNVSFTGVGVDWSTTEQLLSIIFLGFPVMLYSVALVLLINVKALKLLSKTFLFWFKLIYFVEWFVPLQILNHINHSEYNSYATYIMSEALTVIGVVMVIILISSMDGLYLHIWSKRVILLSVSFSFMAGFLAYFLYGEVYYPNTSVTVFGYELHLLGWMRSAVQTLLIFFVKQTVSFWRNPAKSTVIENSTYIVWSE